MKKVLMICAMLFSVITFANAQGGPMGNPEERAKRQTDQLVEKLKLNDDQKAKVSAIYTAQAAGMTKLREEANGDRAAMMAAMTKATEESDAKISAVLTDEQKKEFNVWKEERKEMMRKRMEGRTN